MARCIVLTGGPASGKTRIAHQLAALYPQYLTVVPEAASQVYAAAGKRWNELDTEGQRRAQRQIYHLQLKQEQDLAQQFPGRVLLADRGTVDGAAYWPDGPDAYWRDLASNLEAELRRYEAVVWLETCAVLGVYDGDASNPCRFEDAAEAIRCGQRLHDLWRHHPRFHLIHATADFQQKLASVIRSTPLGQMVAG